MKMNFDVVDTAPMPAASVILLRDTAKGLETFLLKRHGASPVLAGAHVFPGGKVDPADTQAQTQHYLTSSPDTLATRLQEPETPAVTASGLFLAAMREVFEECGVLLACGADGPQAAAARLACADHPFARMLATRSLRLDDTRLLPWSRWITPKVPTVTNKRFDTRFFVAALPPGQQARPDGIETVDGVWLRPREALQRYWDQAIDFAPPQIMTLAHLSHYASVQQVLGMARGHRPAHIAPEPFDEPDGTRITCYPGDPRHSEGQRHMPGPTRLVFRNHRFEPPGGFDALFVPGLAKPG